MKRVSPEEYRKNLIKITSAWMLVIERDELGTRELDLEAIRRAKDTLLSIDEEVEDYANGEDGDLEDVEEAEEPDVFQKAIDDLNAIPEAELLPVGLS